MLPSLRFLARDFTPIVPPDGLTFRARRYSKHAIGGPMSATIDATGPEAALLGLLDWLRYGMVVLDSHMAPAWWGYVHAVDVSTATGSVGVSLDTMFNHVTVNYENRPAGSSGTGTSAVSGPSSSAASIAVYGRKELRASLSNATSQQADALRGMLLARHQWPARVIDIERTGSGAVLTCKGWWYTYAWRYYANTGTTSTETVAQMSAIDSAVNPFIGGVRWVNASGIFSNQYRDGSNTALAEMQALLDTGTTNNRRYTALVTVDRILEVAEEPVAASDYYLTAGGVLVDKWGVVVEPSACPVAFWASYRDVAAASTNLSYVAPAGPVFVEESEYNADSNRLTLRSRDDPNPYDLLRFSQ